MNNIYKDLKILIVDDHFLVHKVIAETLKSLGINNIRAVSTGLDALDLLEATYNTEARFDIVFLDWSMPGISGIEVLELCRSNKNYDSVAFFMLTAREEEGDVLEAIEKGATSYITKPTSTQTIRKHLDKFADWKEKKSKNVNIKKTKTIESIIHEIQPKIVDNTKNIFSSYFNSEIIESNSAIIKQNQFISCGRLYNADHCVIIRFIFLPELLKEILKNLFAEEHIDNEVYEDTGAEIINMLCNQVKKNLNIEGYSFEFDFAKIYTPEESQKLNSEPIINMVFSNGKDDVFFIDVSSKPIK